MAAENVERLKETALGLPEEERAYLARELVNSLPAFEDEFDPAIRQAWIDRAKLSRQAIQAGVPTHTMEEVFSEVDQKIRDAR